MSKEQDKQIIKNTLTHFPNKISKEINDYVINDVLKSSRYIFATRKGRKQYGFCTHCKKDFVPAYRLKHKAKTTCPYCKSKCKVQVAGYSRKYMIDKAYFVYYEKSIANKEAVIARGFDVEMDYSGDYKNVKPKYRIEARYLFEMGNPVFIKSDYWWRQQEEQMNLRRSVFTLSRGYGFMGNPLKKVQAVSIDSIKKAVKGTQFQYSQWQHQKEPYYGLNDYVEYLALYAKHPQIEYLMKLGFGEFVELKLQKESTLRTINWNGKTLDKVLKIDKKDVKEAIEYARLINPFVLHIYQRGKKDGSNFTIQEAIDFRREGMEMALSRMDEISRKTKLRNIMNYLKKQRKKEENQETDPHQYIGMTRLYQVLYTLLDYWRGCKELGLETGKDIPEYPSNLYRAHDNIYSQIKFKKDKELDEKMKKRIEDMKMYEYENSRYFIRPFESTEEIIEEGKALKHCVGGYSKRYANGHTDLLAIRRHEAPEEPFYTMEIRNGRVQQYYGYENNQKIKKPRELIEFVKEFEKEILNIKEIAS